MGQGPAARELWVQIPAPVLISSRFIPEVSVVQVTTPESEEGGSSQVFDRCPELSTLYPQGAPWQPQTGGSGA